MYTRVWHVYIYVIFCEVLSVLASVFSCEFVWTTVSLRSIRACSVWSRRRKTVWQRGTWIKWHRDDGDGDDDGGEKGRKKRRRREKKSDPRESLCVVEKLDTPGYLRSRTVTGEKGGGEAVPPPPFLCCACACSRG